MATVKRPITEAQQEVVKGIPINNDGFIDDYEEDIPVIQIPAFLNNTPTGIISEDEKISRAVLNNTPNNSEAEEQQHLDKLETIAGNYSTEEWEKLLYKAPSDMMADELKRRLNTYEDYLRNTRSNLSILTGQKL